MAISCYIFVSFAQSPTTAITQRPDLTNKDSNARAQHTKSSKPTAATTPDTANNPIVDYDADVMINRGDKILRLIGNVHFHHNGAIIQCDSAFRYDDNRMDFFSRVIIEKDSAFIYGDRVNYDGQTNIADVFAPIVKMTQGSATLYSYNLRFNTKTNVGTFTNGGILSQKGNLMEAERGSFDADAQYARFMDSVAMRNDDYVVRTDSLGYDFDAERVDFLNRTYIWSQDSNFLMADYGNYFTSTKTYLFTSNAYAMTPDNEAWADTMRYITEGRRVYMFSNVQLLDTANTTVGFGDWGYYDDSLGRALLTIKPSVRLWDKGDTSYMKADTIMMLTFDAGKSKLQDTEFGEDSITMSEHNSSIPTAKDTTIIVDTTIRNTILRDSLPRHHTDSLPTSFTPLDSLQTLKRDSVAINDSILDLHLPQELSSPTLDTINPYPTIPTLDTSIVESHPIIDSISPTEHKEYNELTVIDSTENPISTADSIISIDWDQFSHIERQTKKPAGQLPLWNKIARGDLIMIRDTIIADSNLMSHAEFIHEEDLAREQARLDSIKKTEKEQVMRAYHKVRLWSKEYQGVCDSTVSFSIDSTSVMYGEPIIWSKSNQITAEEITMYTKNEHLDWADFSGDPFITQQVIRNDTTMFNQATGKRLETYFSNDELDYAYMSGNVQNIYYMDEEGEVSAMAIITCAELTIIFQDREPSRMIWQGQGEGPIYPIEKIPEDRSRFLEGFSWKDSLRPKSSYEICRRIELPSQRTKCSAYNRPSFRLNQQMEKNKLFYIQNGQWTDRTDIPNVTPQYFIQRNQQLLF